MSGFRKGRSSISNVIALATHVKHVKVRWHITIALFIDIKSGYDCVLVTVPHWNCVVPTGGAPATRAHRRGAQITTKKKDAEANRVTGAQNKINNKEKLRRVEARRRCE